METAISITKQEIAWHKENRGLGPSSAWEKAFIKGLEHLLDLFQQADASQPANSVGGDDRMIDCDYKKCDRHPGDGECDMVGVYIDEDGRCGKMFPAQPDKPVDGYKCNFNCGLKDLKGMCINPYRADDCR